MKYPTTLLFLLIFSLISCREQGNNSSKYNSEYSVGEIPNSSNFLTLNPNEQSLDSMFNGYDTSHSIFLKDDTTQNLISKRDFMNNRSRFQLTENTNGTESVMYKDDNAKDGISAICDCIVFNDTLLINSGIGFFGGSGVSIKVYKNKFAATFYEYIDDVKPYKQNIDSEFTDNINIESKYQSLKFNTQPHFKANQQLTGYLTMTTKDFFERKYGEKTDTNYIKVKLYFTCTTKQPVDIRN